MSLYKDLKDKKRARKHLLPSEEQFLRQVDSIIGYAIELHLPKGSKFILGADDAEQIVNLIASQHP